MGMLFTALIPGGLLGAVIGGAITDATATFEDGIKVYHYLGLQLYCGAMILLSATILLWVRMERGGTVGKEGIWKGLRLRI